jgi:repressor LexA
MLAALTRKQKLILDFIEMYRHANSISPSLEEIRHHFKLRAVSTVHEHVEKLKAKGYLRKEMNQARGIRTTATSMSEKYIEIDVLGQIAAGSPLEAIENAEPILVSSSIIPKFQGNYFALKVKGDSMIEDGILDGDLVIIKSQQQAQDGDIVVAIVGDNEATLKRIYKERDRFRLQPANPNLKPMFYKQVEVRGKLVALLRNY